MADVAEIVAINENVAAAPKAKKAPAAKKPKAPLGEKDVNAAKPASSSSSDGKAIEDIYQKKTQLEHILLRPDTYVGSVEAQQDKMWVFDERTKKMTFKSITYVPGLYKIFDEILVNAADNAQRDTKGMDTIKVEISKEDGYIKVMNNGQGLPVQIHKKEQLWVPEMVFGHLLTSDNYDDTEAKTTGGRNGYGAKLTNIFSKKFIIETGDDKTKQCYKQVFEKNMSKKSEPKIKPYASQPYTTVQFWPDLKRFGLEELTDDHVALMTKRVYDMAGLTSKKMKVYLNGTRIDVKGLQDYADLYIDGESGPSAKCYDKCSDKEAKDRWEVVVGVSDGQFQQVSFVNSIHTSKGGTHVNMVADLLVEKLLAIANKKNKGGMAIKPFHVRQHLLLFVNAQIENPSFDSQTKETLTLKPAKFGSKFVLSDGLLKRVINTGIVDTILTWAKVKETVDMKKKMSSATRGTSKLFVPKLDDANLAGTKQSQECTLILTEGDSAKSLAVAGLSIVGRDKYGVFPLRGKLLNVREATYAAAMANVEVNNLIKILGLQLKKEYSQSDLQGLRYGRVMLMTDQDLDGAHIKGLLLNMFQHWWPSLCKLDGFLQCFITPIVKATKGGNTVQFFSLKDYKEWRALNSDGKGWKIKYYKGLGTSTTAEAKQYFKDIPKHKITFVNKGPECPESVDMAFNKSRADDRKAWMNGHDGSDADFTQKKHSYRDFINKELVQFAKYDVMRSIPSLVDGLKPTQRKILFCAFKRNLKTDIKVAQFVGYVSEQSAYHHGETSLESAIVNMAQDFVGSNNLNYLFPSGQFGTRLQGGKDAASSRYIFTRLNKIARALFPIEDDPILDYQLDDGQKIEPKWYCPVIPTVLCNGADGIGTGYSTKVLNHNPRDLVANLRLFLRQNELEPMHPWYRGFRGSIAENDKGGYTVSGTIDATSDTTVEITELPVGKWTHDYKEFLQELMADNDENRAQREKEKEKAKKGGDDDDKKKGKKDDKAPAKKPFLIEDFREYHTENSVHFVIEMREDQLRVAQAMGLEEAFKLRKNLTITNMMLFDKDGKIQKFNRVVDIFEDFTQLRLEMYAKRKKFMLSKLTRERNVLSDKARFIQLVVDGKLTIAKKKKAMLITELRALKLRTLQEIQQTSGYVNPLEEEEKEEEEEVDLQQAGQKVEKGYDYLLGMPLWSLTYERVEELRQQLHQKEDEIDVLRKTTEPQLWERDLKALEQVLDEQDTKDQKLYDEQMANVAKSLKAAGVAKPKPRPRAAPQKRAAEADDDAEPAKKAARTPAKKTGPACGLSPLQIKAGEGLLTAQHLEQTDSLLARLLSRQEDRKVSEAKAQLAKKPRDSAASFASAASTPAGSPSVSDDEPLVVEPAAKATPKKGSPGKGSPAKATPKRGASDASARKRRKTDSDDEVLA